MKKVVLRDEILDYAHRWPLIVIFFLVGSLVGWLVSSIWPAPYRATAEVIVALDPHRALEDPYVAAYANVDFGNITDYKHWQMSQLTALATSEDYLAETLARLWAQYADWSQVETATLRKEVRVSWRNAGSWQLTAEHSDADHAVQAVETWRAVIGDKVNAALASARSLYYVDQQMRSVADAQLENQLRLTELAEIRAAMVAWREGVMQSGMIGALQAAQRDQLSSLAGQALGRDPNGSALLAEMPAPDADVGDYLPWVARLLAAVDAEVERENARSQALVREQADVNAQWASQLKRGQGLSATLSLTIPSNAPPVVERVRESGLMVLVGGVLGTFAWVGWSLFHLTHKGIEEQ